MGFRGPCLDKISSLIKQFNHSRRPSVENDIKYKRFIYCIPEIWNDQRLNQCWNIVNWTLRDKPHWNFNYNWHIFIQENTFENVICQMASISSRPQCVNKNLFYFSPRNRNWSHFVTGLTQICWTIHNSRAMIDGIYIYQKYLIPYTWNKHLMSTCTHLTVEFYIFLFWLLIAVWF